ncbi:hypothetical protein [Pelagibaculum spongiae]|uniref:hypothetical protein n=1 Tax=Pelagibaculum spongiae TaxID=2080658 RepID=UPI001314D631|nr:hypothetical protein [Pelagibaculum spongiae]
MKRKLWIGATSVLVFSNQLMAQAETASQPSGTLDAITLLVVLAFLLWRGFNPR